MTFLEQLQESAGLLGNQIQNVKPFGNYDPTLASDYVGGPMGLIPQNRFVGNQFQMPFPGGESYTPGAMAPGGYNPLPYIPLPFNQGNVTTTQPGILEPSQGLKTQIGGGGGERFFDPLSPMDLKYQNPSLRGILENEYEGRNIGDKFTFSRDLPFGEAYDQYGRSRNIGATFPGAVQGIANFVTGGGLVGRTLKSLLGMDENTVTPETLETFRQLEESGLLGVEKNKLAEEQKKLEVRKEIAKLAKEKEQKGGGYSPSQGTTGPGGKVGGGSQPQGPKGGGRGQGGRGQGGSGSGPAGGQGQSPGGPGKGRSSSRGPGYGGGR